MKHMKAQINHPKVRGLSLCAVENKSGKQTIKSPQNYQASRQRSAKCQTACENVKDVKARGPVKAQGDIKDVKLYPKSSLQGKLYASLQFGS